EVHVVTSRLKYDDPAARLPARAQYRGVTIHRVWTAAFGRFGLRGRAVDYLTFYLTCAVRLMSLVRSGDVVVIKTDPPLLSIVANSGNMGRVHEYETILGAAELLRASSRIAFVFIGSGVRMRELKAEARRRELDLTFMDYQPRESLAQSLGAADVHLVSLRPQAEGLVVPSKFYGVAAVGRPVIYVGDPDGEIGSVVRRFNCGVAVRNGDRQGLAEAISRLAANPHLCRALGNNARSAFE